MIKKIRIAGMIRVCKENQKPRRDTLNSLSLSYLPTPILNYEQSTYCVFNHWLKLVKKVPFY